MDDSDQDLKRQIDVVCRQFERKWREKLAPRVEDFLGLMPINGRDQGLSELIAAEISLRQAAGEIVIIESYFERFSDKKYFVRKAFLMMAATGSAPQQAETADDPNRRSAVSTDVDDFCETLGRFRIVKQIGRGSFGVVYLAVDTELPRQVAIKVARTEQVRTAEQRQAFIRDAEYAARLKHPNIVTVYDTQSQGDRLYIVQEFMPGGDLKQLLRTGELMCIQAVELMIPIAEAVAFAHQNDIFHRDLKPANILLDERGVPRVADFGIALHESEQQSHRDEYAGTLPYMSPEQVRRESNRLDGRSDTWSLGVIFYEMLTGRRPFLGSNDEVLEQIKHRDPRPPRELKPDLPAEIERICLKCLEKQVGRRYSSAHDLAQDLRLWQLDEQLRKTESQKVRKRPKDDNSRRDETTPPSKGPPRIIPKGLRSFNARDSEFFLELLPGPRDRKGLPESVRFWKAMIEETDASKTFTVGVLHGPSGCGKSSLLKAGVLPKLESHIASVFVEATVADTEVRLLRGLRKVLPQIPQERPLPDVLACIRDGFWNPQRKKILIAVDQFEQWLHAGNLRAESQLVEALRHCDGEHLQCLVLVREDFWTGISRFMQQLEIPLQEGHNSGFVDRFDPFHARKVLEHFGQAYGRLPDDLTKRTHDQEQFLDAAIDQLSEDGRVICVRLALFSDLFKGKSWTPGALQQAGGAAGLGVTFLEETFSAKSAPEVHRRHEKAVQKLLARLLPDMHAEIKGSIQNRDDLLQASGYANNPFAFNELIQIVDEQLRLVTPTDADRGIAYDESTDTHPTGSPQYYQLSHDYLVPSIRQWLRLKESETVAGRTTLVLAERASLWSSRMETRYLPSFGEFLNIHFRTDKSLWTHSQNEMMSAANRYFGRLAGSVVVSLLLISMIAWRFVAVQQNVAAIASIDALKSTAGSGVQFAISNLERSPKAIVLRELQKRFANNDSPRLPILYALSYYGQVHVAELIAAARDVGTEECDNLADALLRSPDSAREELLGAARLATSEGNWTYKTRLATLGLYMHDHTLAAEMLRAEPADSETITTWNPVQRTMFIEHFPHWAGNLQRLARLMQSTPDPSIRSGISLAVGGELISDPRVKIVWKDLLSQWYRDAPDSGTHCAAGWALQDLGVPDLPQEKRQRKSNDWEVTPAGLTMVRISPGEILTEGESDSNRLMISNEYWLSNQEITEALFQQFIDDLKMARIDLQSQGMNTERNPTKSLPVQKVTWYQAVEFCNWLSKREGLETCYMTCGNERVVEYVEDPNKRFAQRAIDLDHEAWCLLVDRDGYRLPTREEWEWACRAKTSTDFCFGNDPHLLSKYARFQDPNGAAEVGRLRCNAWGLFDMHGNVREWCQTELKLQNGNVSRVICGGSWFFNSEFCQSRRYAIDTPIRQISDLGFRLARSKTRNSNSLR